MSPRFAARRRPRSVRAIVAVFLVAGAAAVVLLGLVAESTPLLAVSAVLSVVAGAAALRMLLDELRDARHQHSRDRAVQARRFTRLLADGSAQHVEFIHAMTERVTTSQRDVRELEAALRLSERRAVDAEGRARREAVRVAASTARIAELEVALSIRDAEEADELATWSSPTDTSEVDTVVDLLAWEAAR
jgi:hypothetical protein